MYKEALRPSWVEINLSNLDHNIKKIKSSIGQSQILGVVKADSYGHGAIETAKVLQANGCHSFAVATIQEGIQLRESGITDEITILCLTPNMYADSIVEYEFIPLVCSYDNAKALNDAAKSKNKTVSILIALDTGMGRIGYQYNHPEVAIDELKKMQELTSVKIKGVITHMATADWKDKEYVFTQEKRFNEFCQALTSAGIEIKFKTVANSGSILESPNLLFDACRPGIILYGLSPSEEVLGESLNLKPVMQVKATIVYLKEIEAGESVGYSRKFIAKRPTKIATISVGYADGYPRKWSSCGKVIVGGTLAPIAGSICMDQTMIDVTDVPNVKVGDEVILMGSDGANTISADDIAKATDTINYEITCSFSLRLPKIYI